MTQPSDRKFFLYGPPIIKALILFSALIILAVFAKNQKVNQAKEGHAEKLEIQKEKEVSHFTLGKFYTADWCVYCQKLKKALDKNPETKDWQEIIELVDATKDEKFSHFLPVIFPIINKEEDQSIELLNGYSKNLKSTEYFIEFLKKALKLRKQVLAIHENQAEKDAAETKWQKFSTNYFYRSSLYANCLVKRERVQYATTEKAKQEATKAYESAILRYTEAEKASIESSKN